MIDAITAGAIVWDGDQAAGGRAQNDKPQGRGALAASRWRRVLGLF